MLFLRSLLFSLFLFCFFEGRIDAKINAIASEVAILIDQDTGEVLFQKNVNRSCYPASVTKIATALFILKNTKDLTTWIEAPQEAIGTISPYEKRKNNYKCPAYWIEEGSNHIAIKKGERLSVRDLLHAMLLESANDAANVLAAYFGEGSIEKFMRNLNKYLKSIGCNNTCFLNPHGLYHPGHKTTAKDMALITREAMSIPAFASIVCKKRYECKKTNKCSARTFFQYNKLLMQGAYYYKYATGVKTGYTSDSGPTFVAAASKKGKNLIAVVFQSKKRDNNYKDAVKLFNMGFK